MRVYAYVNSMRVYACVNSMRVHVRVSIECHVQGGPIVKYSSRPNRAPTLCIFRLAVDYSRLL